VVFANALTWLCDRKNPQNTFASYFQRFFLDQNGGRKLREAS